MTGRFRAAVDEAKAKAQERAEQETEMKRANEEEQEAFIDKSRAWLTEKIVPVLQEAAGDVAEDIIVDIDTSWLNTETQAPSVSFTLRPAPKSERSLSSASSASQQVRVLKDGRVVLDAGPSHILEVGHIDGPATETLADHLISEFRRLMK